jgi:hypothetical protein
MPSPLFACFELLHENGHKWDDEISISAADGGHLVLTLSFVLRVISPPRSSTLTHSHPFHSYLLKNKYGITFIKECLEYLHKTGCVLHNDADYEAVFGGHLV